MGLVALSARRQALYWFTRPSFALTTFGTGYCMIEFNKTSPARPPRKIETPVDRAGQIAMAVSGIVGVVAVLQRRGGFSWLAHSYERVAWAGAFGGVTAASAFQSETKDGTPPLGFSAGCALAATAGERLGSSVGLMLLGPLALAGAGCVAFANSTGDQTYEQAFESSALLLLPLLHACPPVHTLSVSALISLSWLGAAALAESQDAGISIGDVTLSPRCMSNLLIAAGTLSFMRVHVARRPICQY